MTAPDPNPYEPPLEAPSSRSGFSDDETEVAQLRRRVEQLERRLGRNWLVSQSQYLRILGVWGYLFIGYLLVFFGWWAIAGLISLVMYLFSSSNPLP